MLAWWCAACVTCIPLFAQAEQPLEIKQWFDKMSRSSQRISYEGTFLYRHGEQSTSMRIVHIATENGERERLTALDGEPREVIRAHSLSSSPKEGASPHAVYPARANLSEALKNSGPIERYYDFTAGGDKRTAGRATKLVIIAPKDQYRYGYRIWLDRQTGTLLRSEMLNEENTVVEQMIFTAFELLDKNSPSFRDLVARPIPAHTHAPENHSTLPPSTLAWRVTKTPAGFEPVEYYKRRNNPHNIVEHVVYSDGLASVSIFIEKEPGNVSHQPTGQTHRLGAVSAYGTRVSDHTITVVGEVPPATVQMMGTSIQFVGMHK